METATFEQAKKFLVVNYKHERLYGRGQEYGDCVVNSELESLRRLANGELDNLCISRYEHATNKTIFYGLKEVLSGKLISPMT